MKKAQIKELVDAPINDDELNELALKNKDKEDTDYLNDLMTVHPKKGRAVQLFLAGGYKRAQLASMLGVNVDTISRWLREPAVKQYMTAYQKEESMLVQARMKAAATAALEKMVDLMESPIDGVALQAAKDLLDRAGHKPKQEVKKTVEVKTFEQKLTDLIGDESIDVDYEEVD